MKVTYKLQLKNFDTYNKVLLPFGSQIISADDQNSILCIWYVCNPENKLEERTIYIYCTGQELPENIASLRFINTVLKPPFVFHVYEGDLP